MSIKRAILTAPEGERANKRRAIEPQREAIFHLWGDLLGELQKRILSFLYPPDRSRFSKTSRSNRSLHTHAETRQWFVLSDLKKECHRFDFLPEDQIDSLSFKMLFGTDTPTLRQLQFTRVLTSYVSQSYSMRIMRNPLHHVHGYSELLEGNAYGFWHLILSKRISLMGGRFIPILFQPNKLLANETTIELIKDFIVKFYGAIKEDKAGIFASPAYVDLVTCLKAEGFEATVATLPFHDLRDDERKSKLRVDHAGSSSESVLSEMKYALMQSFHVSEDVFLIAAEHLEDNKALAVKLLESSVCQAFFRDEPRAAKKVFAEIAQFPSREKKQILAVIRKIFHSFESFEDQKKFARRLTQLVGFHPLVKRLSESSPTYLRLRFVGGVGLIPAMLTDHIDDDPALFEKAFAELDAWFPFIEEWEIHPNTFTTLLYGSLKYLTASPCVYEDESAPFTTDLSFDKRTRVLDAFFELVRSHQGTPFASAVLGFFKNYTANSFDVTSSELDFDERKERPVNRHYLFIEMIVFMANANPVWINIFSFIFDVDHVPSETWRERYCLIQQALMDWFLLAKDYFFEPNPAQFEQMNSVFNTENFEELMIAVLVQLLNKTTISSLASPELNDVRQWLSPASTLWRESLTGIAKLLFISRTHVSLGVFHPSNVVTQLLEATASSHALRNRIRHIPEDCVELLYFCNFRFLDRDGIMRIQSLPWVMFLLLYTPDTLFSQLLIEIEHMPRSEKAAQQFLEKLMGEYALAEVYEPFRYVSDVKALLRRRVEAQPALGVNMQQVAGMLLMPPPAPPVSADELEDFLNRVLK